MDAVFCNATDRVGVIVARQPRHQFLPLTTLTHALLRLPGANFAAGQMQAPESAPDPELALEQHRAYCEALSDCGLSLTVLPADPAHPDAARSSRTRRSSPSAARSSCVPAHPRGAAKRMSSSRRRSRVSSPISREFAHPAPWTAATSARRMGTSDRTISARQCGGRGAARAAAGSLGYRVRHRRYPPFEAPPASQDRHDLSGRRPHGRHGRRAARPPLGLFELIEVAENERYAANCVARERSRADRRRLRTGPRRDRGPAATKCSRSRCPNSAKWTAA